MPTGEIAIPVSVTIIIMGLYIFGGATVFCKWEKDWDMISSIYFTWVTLTTIGFGDYTPGSSFHGELTIEQVGCLSCRLSWSEIMSLSGSQNFLHYSLLSGWPCYHLNGDQFVLRAGKTTRIILSPDIPRPRQIKRDADWMAYALGFKEDEETIRRRLTRTKWTGVKQTPRDKTGNKHDFFSFKRRGGGELTVSDVE